LSGLTVYGRFQEKARRELGHPAPFPLELPKRCIKLFSLVGDRVLDPFLGSGTTLIACALLDREGIRNILARDGLIKEARMNQERLFY